MRTIDKIRKYINQRLASGELTAGSRLPSSNEMMRLFESSYATVRLSLRKLADEGLVDVANGRGSFVAGARKLDVIFYCLPTSVEFDQLERLLEKHINKNCLHLNIHLRNVFNLITGRETGAPDNVNKVVIVECAPEMTYNIPGLYNFIDYDGYSDLLRKLMPETMETMNGGLPFYSYTSQLAVNDELLRKTGFPMEQITGDFLWWEDFVAACGKVNLCPASFDWKREAKWPFNNLYCPFFSLKLHETNSLEALLTPRKPYFEGYAGRRLLEIIGDCKFSYSQEYPSFFEGNAVMNLSQSSWITVQNKKRANINVNDLKIIPYRLKGKNIINLQTNNLHTYISPTANTEEKSRIWKLLQLLLSKSFQKEFCGMSGSVSVRKDLAAKDYAWYCDEFASFMPTAGDIIIHNQVFSRSMKAYLTALIEQYKFNHADKNVILKFMDNKIQQ
jgi:DNA-binding transcriptional regulator YhcF (GntR family)